MAMLRGIIERKGEFSTVSTLHAALTVILPAIATLVALLRAVTRGLAIWELVLTAVMYFATVIGITVGLHRMLSHRSFVPSRSLKIALTILGSMAAQGPPIYWASNHRRHHTYTDRAGDLHSPHCDGMRQLKGLKGFWHAHIGWTFGHSLTNTAIFSKDLLKDRDLAMVNRNYYWWIVLGLAIPGIVGWIMVGRVDGIIDGVLWGGGVRLFLSYHFIAAVNSITHVMGYRRFDTHEHSRNNVWLAIPTMGEAWHNNHHANPTLSRLGLTWWEVDIGWVFLRACNMLGLIQSLKRAECAADSDEARVTL
jgi:stearoyl-CoA desaturase (Delta-9 desaturase)